MNGFNAGLERRFGSYDPKTSVTQAAQSGQTRERSTQRSQRLMQLLRVCVVRSTHDMRTFQYETENASVMNYHSEHDFHIGAN